MITTSPRIYPLRLNKRRYNIPIHIKHVCSERCAKILRQSPCEDCHDEYHFVLEDNPTYKDGKCSDNDKILPGSVNLDNFDLNNPQGSFGTLYNPDEVVILDRKIKIDVDFPLMTTVKVIVDFAHPNITKSELLYIISILYKHIYEEEERTAEPLEYTIQKPCDKCQDKKNSDYVITFKPNKKEAKNECAICYADYTKTSASKLPCSHIFHTDCLTIWLDTENKNTCPLCRKQVLDCDECDGSKIQYESYESAVIPVEHRGGMFSRNPTFGAFGIHSHDLEDLEVESLYYDRIEKKLHLSICC